MLDWCKIGVSEPGVAARQSALVALVGLGAGSLLKRALALRCWCVFGGNIKSDVREKFGLRLRRRS